MRTSRFSPQSRSECAPFWKRLTATEDARTATRCTSHNLNTLSTLVVVPPSSPTLSALLRVRTTRPPRFSPPRSRRLPSLSAHPLLRLARASKSKGSRSPATARPHSSRRKTRRAFQNPLLLLQLHSCSPPSSLSVVAPLLRPPKSIQPMKDCSSAAWTPETTPPTSSNVLASVGSRRIPLSCPRRGLKRTRESASGRPFINAERPPPAPPLPSRPPFQIRLSPSPSSGSPV